MSKSLIDYRSPIDFIRDIQEDERGPYDYNLDRSMLRVLTILSKYGKEHQDIEGADHDAVYLSCPDNLSEEDARLLVELGCHVENDGLCKFV